MTFTSLSFFALLVVLIFALAITKKEIVRQIEILIASVIFYGLWDYRFLIVICFVILAAFGFGRWIHNDRKKETGHSKAKLIIGLVVLLSTLVYFKYFNFFISSFCYLFGISNYHTLSILLPVGISFYIFSAIGYLIDEYREDVKDTNNLFEIAYYILFFPKVLQGPLLKANDFFSQLKEDHSITADNFQSGIQIFMFGLLKKVVIADRLGLFVDTVYALPQAYNAPTLILAVLSYPVQLYCDFSGYTDMALGVAKIMGYELCPNFNLPFMSKSVAEYWRRWHMSLNIWFRDYLFYSIIRSKWISGIRKKAKKKSKVLSKTLPAAIGMAIVWPLVGFWHGASLNYILYGALYGVLMIIGLIITESKKELRSNNTINVIRILRTDLIAVFALLLFRANSLNAVGSVLSGIFTWQSGVNYIYTWSLALVPFVIGVCIYAYIKNDGNSFYLILDLKKFKNKVIFSVTAMMIVILMYVGENYFMYFQY